MSYPDMFVDIIQVFILQWLATDNDQQSYQRLNALVLDILRILCELGSRT